MGNLLIFNVNFEAVVEFRMHSTWQKRVHNLPTQENISEGRVELDRRIETRLRVNIPVEVTWTDAEGQQLKELTFVEDVSDLGCRFSVLHALKQSETVSIQIMSRNGRLPSSEKPKLFKVMWVSKKPKGVTVGARLTEERESSNSSSEAAKS